MPKINLKTFFQIEYIIIFISLFIFMTTQIFKSKTNKSFYKLDKDFAEIQILYNQNDKSPEYKDNLMAEIQNECLPFIYFSSEAKHTLIKILELFKYDATPWNTNHQNSRHFTELVVTFYSEIKDTKEAIIFGHDCMIYLSTMLMFFAAALLISKKNENQEKSLPESHTKEGKPTTVKEIAAFSVFTLAAIASNCLTSRLPRIMPIPVYLDSTFTIAVTAVCGLPFGLICAVGSNFILFLLNECTFHFVICHMMTAVFASMAFQHFRKTKSEQLTYEIFLWAGLWSGLSNAIVGDIIAAALFDNSTTFPILDGSVLGLFVIFKNLTAATYVSGLFTNLADKFLCASISFSFYKLSMRLFKNSI